jgi:hypothetical protein
MAKKARKRMGADEIILFEFMGRIKENNERSRIASYLIRRTFPVYESLH